MPQFTITNSYGPLSAGSFGLEPGYSALVGSNNAGKSAVLQFIAAQLLDDPAFGPDAIAFVGPDRHHAPATIETSGRNLATFNGELVGVIRNQPAQFQGASTPNPVELSRLLLTHTDMYEQLGRISELLVDLGLPRLRVAQGQSPLFEDVASVLQGSGLRALLPILAALTDEALRALLIDEPELSLEPMLQRRLRGMLREFADAGRLVLVATHSHLLIPTDEPQRIFRVERDRSVGVTVNQLNDLREVMDCVFRLLGNEVEDLFIPRNYVIVEGPSDQVIFERALDLLGGDPGKAVKVLAAGGISEVGAQLAAVIRLIRPLVVPDSPYAERAVVMIDRAPPAEQNRVDEIGRVLGTRLIQLPASSIEQYIPEPIYDRAGLDKVSVLEQLDAAHGDRRQLAGLKREYSNRLAATIVDSDLADMPELRQAVAAAVI